jgi:hypothetical protein
MKTTRTFTAVVILAIIFVGRASAQPVHFDDMRLKAAVEVKLGVTDPTPANMLLLTELYASNGDIFDLTGLEYAANLTYLGLGSNHVSGLSPLAGLTNLKSINLSGNQVSDIFSLSGLPRLEFLDLSGNQISNISPLAGLTKLEDLSLEGNQLSDLSPLAGLTKLVFLDLDDNQLSNLSPLAGLIRLEFLDLSGNQFSDLSPLAGMTRLEVLDLEDNQFNDLSPLAGLTRLEDLDLKGNQFTDLSPLTGLTNLEYLYLNDNPLNQQACDIYIPQIRNNNPGIRIYYDSCSNILTIVPNVVGITLDEARFAISDAGLFLGNIIYADSNTVPQGNVISQDPTAGIEVFEGTSVKLVISNGPSNDPNVVGLVAHWRLDETTGTIAADSSGNGNNGILYGGPIWQPTEGRLKGALQFDGMNDYVDCGNLSSLDIRDKITLACWIKVAAFTRKGETILAKGDNSYSLSRSGIGNSIHMGISGTSLGGFDGTTVVTDSNWHHVAAVYDGSNALLYIDGLLNTAVPATGQINVSTYNLFIGESSQIRGKYLTGLVDDVRIYNWALNPVDISHLIPGETSTDPNLVGWWNLDETSGAIAADSSGYGNNGTVHGDPVWQPTGGKINGALWFDGSDDYVTLPIGSLISSLTDCTISTWANWSGLGYWWQRFFDFGSGTTTYMCLRTSDGTKLLFAITNTGGGGESQLIAPSNLATGWHHLAVVINGTTKGMQLYLDGSVIATATTKTLPKDLGSTTQNWLGKSQHGYTYYYGSLDDFRIYNRTFGLNEITQLWAGGLVGN